MSTSVQVEKYPKLDRTRVSTRLIGGALLNILGLSLVGWGILHISSFSALSRWDDHVNTWLYLHRTSNLNSITNFGSSLGGAPISIGVMAVAFFLFRLWLERWRESWAIIIALVGQPIIFLSVERIVKRPRPHVPHLGFAPPTFSFPSGHVGAAVVVYGFISIIVWRELPVRWLAVVISGVLLVVPIVVGYSRMYEGMHQPTDVIFALVGFGIWIALVLSNLTPSTKKQEPILKK